MQVFTDPRKRQWLIAITVGVVLTLAGVFVLLYRTVPRTDLKVSDFSVQPPSKVAAKQHEVYSSGSETKEEVHGHDSIDATAIDMTLKNSGTAPAVLLGSDAKILYAEQLADCNDRGGEITVAAEYSIKLPDNMPDRPFVIPRDIRFEVRGGATDRFTLSIGPQEQTGSSTVPWVIVAEVNLRHDDGATTRAGTAALVTFAGQGLENLEVAPLWNRDCIRENGDKVAKALSLQAEAQADELRELGRRYNILQRGAGSPAKPSCTTGVVGEINTLCGTFAGDRLTVELELRSPPVPGSTAFDIVISGPNGKPRYVTPMAYTYNSQGVPDWQIDYPSDGKTHGGIGFEDITIHGNSVKMWKYATTDLLLAGQGRIEVRPRGEKTTQSVPITRGA
ncbi:hypothetical protein [Amycolatopsis sp. WAC 04169]|uniref:hypothetical protein n=1 Tax=Amycolatopsis sp. WAC 04169 TaxID=2203197 RepID=UPI000F794B72|nr:hypothetical protein [Amycolatopsis sp. WAC 04169]